MNIHVNRLYSQERQGKDPVAVSEVTLSLANAKRDDITGTEMAGRKTKRALDRDGETTSGTKLSSLI